MRGTCTTQICLPHAFEITSTSRPAGRRSACQQLINMIDSHSKRSEAKHALVLVCVLTKTVCLLLLIGRLNKQNYTFEAYFRRVWMKISENESVDFNNASLYLFVFICMSPFSIKKYITYIVKIETSAWTNSWTAKIRRL